MIISHQHKFIFIKTQKTAGTSLEDVLARVCGNQDIIAPSSDRKLARNYRTPISEVRFRDAVARVLKQKHPLGRKFYNHMPASYIKRTIKPELWESYTKFTVVRHPYDRVLSLFYWRAARSCDNETGLEEFVRNNASEIAKHWQIYAEGQHLLVDDVIFYETLHDCLERMLKKLNLPMDLLTELSGTRYKSGMRPREVSPDSAMSHETKTLIYLLCKNDFEKLGYKSGLNLCPTYQDV